MPVVNEQHCERRGQPYWTVPHDSAQPEYSSLSTLDMIYAATPDSDSDVGHSESGEPGKGADDDRERTTTRSSVGSQ